LITLEEVTVPMLPKIEVKISEVVPRGRPFGDEQETTGAGSEELKELKLRGKREEKGERQTRRGEVEGSLS
jgi:hypothetical protein